MCQAGEVKISVPSGSCCSSQPQIGAECDRIVPSGVVRQTAARYQHGTYVEIRGSDHMVFSGAALPVTMGHIDDWIARNHELTIA